MDCDGEKPIIFRLPQLRTRRSGSHRAARALERGVMGGVVLLRGKGP